jgi:GTPase SAR1 family protein
MQSIYIKIALIGDKQTGKTRFTRLVNNIEETDYTPTLGVDVAIKDIIHNGTKYVLNFWDCAGDERYMGLGRDYLINSDYVLLFTNQDDNKTELFKQWIPENTKYHIVQFTDLNVEQHINSILIELYYNNNYSIINKNNI